MTKMAERFFCFVVALLWSFCCYDFLLAFFLLLLVLLDLPVSPNSSYNFTSIRSFVSLEFCSELAHQFFLIFCMKLWDYRCYKVTEPDICGKFILPQIQTKKAQKQSVLHFFENLVICVFLNKMQNESYFDSSFSIAKPMRGRILVLE